MSRGRGTNWENQLKEEGEGGCTGEEEPATLVPSSSLNSGRKL